MSEHRFFVGIDWATQAHQVCVLNAERKVIDERSVAHSGEALGKLRDWLVELSGGAPASVAVAIELSRGPVVEGLSEAGICVFALNPKQLDRFRDRHTVAGAKDDRRDAYVLADALSTDLHLFREVRADDPQIIEVREINRAREDLVEEKSRLTNRLREQLHRYFPQMLALVAAADEPWLWTLLELAATPEAGRALKAAEIEKVLRKHRIRKHGVAEVLAALRAPELRVAPGVVPAAAAHVRMLLPRLTLVDQQRRQCEGRLDELLAAMEGEKEKDAGQKNEHRDVKILRSLPGIARIVAATMLAEASTLLRERDYHGLRALGGAAPVTRQSGKHRQVVMRHACNQRLREALYHWARVAVQRDERSRALYHRARTRGLTHGTALRNVADRNLAVLVAMLRHGQLYDPGRRGLPPAASKTP